MLRLLAARRFGPLWLTQALSAFNDNLIRNALVVLAIFRLGQGGAAFTALAGALFIAPYALLSATGGQLADRFAKPRLIVINKAVELALMALAGLGCALGSVPILLAVLAGLGMQATLFSPLKYGSLPEQLAEHELVPGNGLIEAGTFLAIVLGTVAGGGLMLLPGGGVVIAWVGGGAAVLGLLSALAIPKAAPAAPGLAIGRNIVRETGAILAAARRNRPVWLCIVALSWFWALGATVLSELPVVVRDVIGAPGQVLTAGLALFALGVGVGSVAAARLLRGELSPRHVPFACLGLALFIADFAHASAMLGARSHGADALALLSQPLAWRAGLDLMLLAACGGAFSVPLYAILQDRSPPEARARMIAANNVVNAVATVLAAAVVGGLSALGAAPDVQLYVAAAADLVMLVLVVRAIPRDVVRVILRGYFRLFHRADVRGLERFHQCGERMVIVANHLSFGDAAFIATFLPGDVTFAIYTPQMEKSWVRLANTLIELFPVDIQSPYSIKRMVEGVRAGKKLVIFPEGRLTRTGTLMKIYEGAALVADKGGATLLPVVIDGLQFTRLGKMPAGRVRYKLFPRLTLRVLPPVGISPDPAQALSPRQRRRQVGTALENVMRDSLFRATDTGRSLFTALLDARRKFGGKTVASEDITRTAITVDRLVLGAAALGRALARLSQPRETLGVMLPNANAASVTFFGLQAFGRIPAMLNHAAGAEAMLTACRAAQIRTVICSRAFVAKAKLEPVVARMAGEVRFVWLEDVRAGIGRREKLRAKWDSWFPRRLPGAANTADAPAVVLFTSGSEGVPKGVVLSHRNLLANCAQIAAVIDFHGGDRVFLALPMFHSFGLVGGLILPLLYGVPAFYYPSPLHYRIISNMIYDTECTILFGTDTFLGGWARYAHPYDLQTVRYVFAGAERVREETRRLYADRFGVRLLEGYGATETAPVLALNTAMHARPGSVGRFLPGLEWELEPVEGIETGGRLRVRGPNVMLGYLRDSAPGVLEAPPGGWYDTGDIVTVDADGFCSITGRVRRFAKIAGEMISMVAAEGLVATVWPDDQHAVIAIPDHRKGEQLLLVTTRERADMRDILRHARERHIPEIMVPRVSVRVPGIPLLPSGKINYPEVQTLAAAARAAEAVEVHEAVAETVWL